MIDQQKAEALRNWLIAGAQPQKDFLATMDEIGQRLVSTGAHVDIFRIFGRTIHPTISGRLTNWTPKGGARHSMFSYADVSSARFVGSTEEACMETRRMVRHIFGNVPALDSHENAQNLMKRGYSEQLVLPMALVHLPMSGLSFMTKHQGGFADDEVRLFRSLQAPIARVMEIEYQYINTASFLSAYVGRNAGELVMDGRILRGDGENIPAVILFADLKGFTELSNATPASEVIATLNRFYDALDLPIRQSGGEILKLIGDGLLAVFPTPDDLTAQTAAAVGALTALDDARTALAGTDMDFRASLHVGDIHYGNVGSAERLDFTAIGPAVNLAARMLGAASEKGVDTVCSAVFADIAPARASSLGAFGFKGFDTPQEVFAVS